MSVLGTLPSNSAVAANLRALAPGTLATLNDCLITGAAARAMESGRKVRIDSTVVPMAIMRPRSALLYDGGRVLLRLLRRAERLADFSAYHHGHLKRANRRWLAIEHAAPRTRRHYPPSDRPYRLRAPRFARAATSDALTGRPHRPIIVLRGTEYDRTGQALLERLARDSDQPFRSTSGTSAG